MNVDYKEWNCVDIAKSLKLDKTTVSAWCRKGYIKYQDVSEPGSKKPRYCISQAEFERISKLIRTYGRRKWLLYNEPDKSAPVKQNTVEPEYVGGGDTPFEEVTQVPIKLDTEETIPTVKPFKIDDVVTTISYIQDIKERLNDIEAEKNQLTAELEALRKEVMEYL